MSAGQDGGSFWRSGVAALLGLLGFVGLVGLLPQPPLQGPALLAASLALALVPALLWLAFFYQQDRREPEPKRVVMRVFLLGGLLASGAGLPLSQGLFRVDHWSQGHPWLRLAALILLVGASQEFLKYAAVRYTVFPTPEFNDRLDGIIYGVAAGLGYATALNLEFVLSKQGVILFVGSLRVVDTALLHAALGAVSGYFLAGARHGLRPVWWVPLGLLLAASLNGSLGYLREEAAMRGLTYEPGRAFVLAVVFVVLVLATLMALIRRAEDPWPAEA